MTTPLSTPSRGKSFLLTLTCAFFVTLAGCGFLDALDDWEQDLDDMVEDAFTGVYQSGDGMAIELAGGDAYVRAFGSSEFGAIGDGFSIGDKYMVNMSEREPGEWRGHVASPVYTDGRISGVMLDWGTVFLDGGELTFTDNAGVDRRFDWVKPSWSDAQDPGTQPPADGPVVLLEQGGLSGDELSSTRFTIRVPPGARSLEVVLTEEEIGYQVADLFVKFGSAPSVSSKYPYSYSADCASVLDNRATERCVFTNPAAGDWHILVYGYHRYWGAKLTATLTP